MIEQPRLQSPRTNPDQRLEPRSSISAQARPFSPGLSHAAGALVFTSARGVLGHRLAFHLDLKMALS